MQRFNWITQLAFYPLSLGAFLGIAIGFALKGYMLFEQISVLSGLLALLALSLNIISYIFVRDADRAALLGSVVFLWIFSFGSFVNLIKGIPAAYYIAPDHNEIIYLILYSIIGLLAIWFSCAEPKYRFISRNLGRVVIFLFIVSLAWEVYDVSSAESTANLVTEMNRRIVSQLNVRADWKPDIYYIILDATGSADTLRNVYGIKDIELFSHLRRLGFFVADESRSNYDRTMLSLSSSLNFSYINYLQDWLPKHCTDFTVPFRLMQKNQLTYCLKKLGYKIVNVSSGFPPTEYNPYADINISSGCCNDVYGAIAYGMTIQRPFEKYNHFLGDLIREKKSWIFTHIDYVAHIKGPKFVFIHILLPHPPFIFGADGTALPLDERLEREPYTIEKYGGQVSFAFSQAQTMIDSLMKAPNGPAIIVLQGDHGPALNYSPYQYTDAYLKERFGILNAYFLPNCPASRLYSSISPVNTFRVILNQYFRANLPLLPDKSYYAPSNFYTQFRFWKGVDNTKMLEEKPLYQ